jgi:hypothetical protein
VNDTRYKIREISMYHSKPKEGFMSQEVMGKYRERKGQKKTRKKLKTKEKKKMKKKSDEGKGGKAKKKKKKKVKEEKGKTKQKRKKSIGCDFEIYAGKFDSQSVNKRKKSEEIGNGKKTEKKKKKDIENALLGYQKNVWNGKIEEIKKRIMEKKDQDCNDRKEQRHRRLETEVKELEREIDKLRSNSLIR